MIEFDARALTEALVKLEQVCDELPQIAEQVRAEALGHAILGARLNIYNTAPGAYQRTQDYLRGLDVTGRGTPNTASVTVSNSTEYAAYVEAGYGGMSLAMLQHLALGQADPGQPFTLGRSGVQWVVPGPILTGAQVFALYRMQELFARKVGAVSIRR